LIGGRGPAERHPEAVELAERGFAHVTGRFVGEDLFACRMAAAR
jgi:hypothetical protein